MSDAYSLNQTQTPGSAGFPYYGPTNAPANGGDPWGAFPDAPVKTTPGAKIQDRVGGEQVGGDPWMAFPDKPTEKPQEAPKSDRKVGGFEAAGTGALEGLTFGARPAIQGAGEVGQEELAKFAKKIGIPEMQLPGIIGTQAPILGAVKMLHDYVMGHKDENVKNTYERGRKAGLEEQDLAKEQHPYAYLGGQLASALATPLGAAGGATAAARIGRGLVAGGATGGLYGAGESLSKNESPADIALSGAKGAAVGAPLGMVGAGGAELAGKAAGRFMQIKRGATDAGPEVEAARQTAAALRADAEKHGLPFGQHGSKALQDLGVTPSIMDFGGQHTRDLAKIVSKSSSDAWRTLGEFTSSRLEAQKPRLADFIRNLGGGHHAADDLIVLQQLASKANRPAYARAYAAGNKPLTSPELDRLSPALSDAMSAAIERGHIRAIADGVSPTKIQNLQFWDYVQRELRDQASKAFRSGANEEANALNKIHRSLVDELDKLVPAFGSARSQAHDFFKASNAIEAGKNFVMMNAPIGEARRALSKMNTPERELFARAFADELAEKVTGVADNQSVINKIFLGSDKARQKIEMALGAQRARELETALRVESILDKARTNLGGSDTARNLMLLEAAKTGGHGLGGAGAVAAFEAVKEQDIKPSHLIAAALGFGALRHGAHVVDQRVAGRIAEMLISHDPAVLAKGIKIVEKSPTYFNALRNATAGGTRVGIHDVGPMQAAAGVGAGLQTLIKSEEELGHRHHDLQDQMGQ